MPAGIETMARRRSGAPDDYDPLTRRLIAELGFHAVAVEADWPDAYRVLRHCNDGRPEQRRAGFYGLDLYSLYRSIQAVLEYLDKVDPEAAQRARCRYSCFERFGEDTQEYGYAAGFGLSESCEQEAVSQLVEIERRAGELAQRDERLAADEFFYAEQNARLVRNGEEYSRAMFRGRVSSWNLRDRHMATTLAALLEFLDRTAGRARIVVWAHNSHLGDARATEVGEGGWLNIGRLAREQYGPAALLVGFTTYARTVTAAADWGGPAERKRVRPGLPGSFEAAFHETGLPRILLAGGRPERPPQVEDLPDACRGADLGERLERAIGAIYRPESERISHYFRARLAEQFDAVIHIDETRAVEPLERTPRWQAGEVPATYPMEV